MATLKYSMQRMLPTPLSPTRLKTLDTDTALRQLGFDADFDTHLQCKVDAISAAEDLAQTCLCGQAFPDGEIFCRTCFTDRSDVLHTRRLHFLRARLEAQRQRVSLPCACVLLRKAMKVDDGKSKKGAASEQKGDMSPEEAKNNLVEKVAAAARVFAEDVAVEAVGDCLQCSFQISRPGASVLGMRDIMAAATKDKGGGLTDKGDPSGIHRAFVECGTIEDLSLVVSASWAPERVLEEVKFIHSGYVLEQARLDDIMQAAADSRAAYDDVWKEILREEVEAAPVLLSYVPLGHFVGAGAEEILPMEDGVADGLTVTSPKQEFNKLRPLMEAAAEAHMQLKQALAPDTAWAQEAMHDMFDVPYEDERRRVTATDGPWSWVPGALLVDLGLKPERRIFEKAKWQQRPEQMLPPLKDVLDISRVVIVFDSCKDLCAGVEKLQQQLSVLSLENGFLNPMCMGHRGIFLTVRHLIKVEHAGGIFGTQTFVSKLLLEHKDMFNVKEGAGAAHLKQVRALLTQIGTVPRELDNLQRIMARELGCTKAQMLQAQEEELNQALACAVDPKTLAQKDGPELSQRLINEAIEQALAAGVPQMRVIVATARAGVG